MISAAAALRTVLSPLSRRRDRRVARLISPFVDPPGGLLDVGCGDSRVAWEIGRQTGAAVCGADLRPARHSLFPVRAFAGRTLPFPDASFGQVLLCFVLHHCADPDSLLKEAARVARRRLIVVEDVVESPAQRRLAEAHDWLVNRLTEPDMPLPYRFRSEREWRAAFAALGLAVSGSASLASCPWTPVRQTLFVAEKPD